MRVAASIGAIVVGTLLAPLAISSLTAWLVVVAASLLVVLTSGLALDAGVRGEPGVARAWGAWTAVACLGAALLLERTSWSEGAWWAWTGPLLALGALLPLSIGASVVGAAIGDVRCDQRVRAIVARRHRLGGVVGDLPRYTPSSVE